MAAAESLLTAGQASLAAGDLATACARFAESQRLAPGPTALEALATCHERQGKLATAWAELREASRQADASRKGALFERSVALEPSLPHLTIVVVSRGGTPTVTRDGQIFSPTRWGIAEVVDPGPHRVGIQTSVADTRAFVNDWIDVTLAPGESRVVEVPPARGMPGASTQRGFGYALAALGAVTFVTGIALRVVAARTASSGPVCDGPPPECSMDASERSGTVDTERTLGAFSIVLGLAFVGGGVALVANAPDPSPPPPRAAMLNVGGRFLRRHAGSIRGFRSIAHGVPVGARSDGCRRAIRLRFDRIAFPFFRPSQ